MDANWKLIQWTARWAVMSNQVVCTRCMVGQPLDDALLPFKHDPSCQDVDRDQYPWRELVAILENRVKLH